MKERSENARRSTPLVLLSLEKCVLFLAGHTFDTKLNGAGYDDVAYTVVFLSPNTLQLRNIHPPRCQIHREYEGSGEMQAYVWSDVRCWE